MDFDRLTTRDVPIVPERAALLVVDVQNFSARRDGGEFRDLPEDEVETRYGWFFRHIAAETLPNIARLLAVCRAARVEVVYTVIESLTRDGRDRSLDYRITGFNVPRGSWDARVLDAVAPAEDEIVLPKTSSNSSCPRLSTTCCATSPAASSSSPASSPTSASARRSATPATSATW